ncbi:MAG: SusC/RagA family TonB-linked outer membrane protein [Saprospiraceae bacterium]|nr:SusC/RagA family TonB-linked outer membrane protein [Saprospiraceae bacterium]
MRVKILPPFIALIPFLWCGSVKAQTILNGLVVDAGDESPLVGVNVYLQNDQNTGTTTAYDGTYSLEVTHANSRVVFSYLGYQTTIQSIDSCLSGPVYLQTSASFLDEVVVTGYGTQRRSEVSGSIATLKERDIVNQTAVSVESVLQGTVSGVMVNTEGGKLGYNMDVNIRGVASINASQQPLYIVDGTILNTQESVAFSNPKLNPLTGLAMSDIESIDILKDASAAAIYGSRASNGVIIITTKSGAAQQAKIEVNTSYGWSTPTFKRNFLNAKQYLELWDEAFHNVANADGLVFGMSAEQWKDQQLPGWRDGYDTKWEDLMYDPDAGQKNINVGISGGDTRTKFFISGGYTDQNGIMILNDFKRLIGRVNVSHSTNDKLDFGMKMSLARTDLGELAVDWSVFSPGSLSSQSPVQPLYDPESPKELFANTIYPHARFYLDNADWTSKELHTLSNAYMNWHPVRNLTLHSDFGVDLFSQDREVYANSQIIPPGGQKFSENSDVLSLTLNSYLNYRLSGNRQNLDVTGGMSYQESTQGFLAVAGRNFPNDDFKNLDNAGEIFVGGERKTGYSQLSYFSRALYNWDQKYLLSVSARIDGDSRFGIGSRYGLFPAASLAWVLSEENFLQHSNFINYLKIRASWGLTGNTPIDHFPSLGLYDGGRYGGLPTIVQSQIANPDLRWETTEQINFGVDFGLANDRFSGEINVYSKQTRDLLLQVNIPATTGFSTQLQNVGRLSNNGIEISLNSHNLVGKFKWQTNLNWALNKNEINDLNGQIIESFDFGGAVNRAIEGEPLGTIFAAEFAGVDPSNGDALYYLNNDTEDDFENRPTTNNINEANRVAVGNPHPDFIYGITNRFQYKNFVLTVLLQGVHGNEIYNAANRWLMDGFGWFDNQDMVMLNRWRNPGDETNIPQVRFLQGARGSSRFISDASYLRLKTLRFSWDITNWAASLGMHQLQLYFTGQNLITWTNYAYGDPEVNTDVKAYQNNGSIMRGISIFTPPQAKTFLIGIQATF